MKVYALLDLFDNWNSRITINDNDLNPIIKGKYISKIVEKCTDPDGCYSGVLLMEVVAFGYYDHELTVRVRESEVENETDDKGT